MELRFNPGDLVRLRLALDEIDGTILESADNSVFLLKLDSGYNIGIPKENVLGGRVLAARGWLQLRKTYSAQSPETASASAR